MTVHRSVYQLLESIVRTIQYIAPAVPLRDYARSCVDALGRELAEVQARADYSKVGWGLITDRAGNPVATVAVSELTPRQVEELEDAINSVINRW